MQNLNPVSKKFLSVCLGISLVLISVSILVFAIGNVSKSTASVSSPAIQNAAPAPAAVGEIMMTTMVYNDNSTAYLVWNTITGKCVRYYYSNVDGKYIKEDMPENPFDMK